MNWPYDRERDPGDETEEVMDEKAREYARTVRACANWRKEIFEHYTCLEAYADAGIEKFEELLRGK